MSDEGEPHNAKRAMDEIFKSRPRPPADVETLRDQMENLQQYVLQLEYHLGEYHDALEEALDVNAQFQLKATWGIIDGASFLGSMAAVYGLWRTFDLPGGIIGGVGQVVIFLVIWMALIVYSNRGQENDVKKLYRWPDWRKDRKNTERLRW